MRVVAHKIFVLIVNTSTVLALLRPKRLNPTNLLAVSR
jgi:hypothetical protein